MANVQSKIPARPKTYTTVYNKFKGADFSTDPTQISDGRSSMPLNLIADAGGFPEKRPGWESTESFDGRINGLFRLVTNSETHYLVHAGTRIYRWYPNKETEPALMFDGVPDGRSTAVVLSGRLWILSGAQYLVYGEFEKDPEEESEEAAMTWQIKPVSEIAYVPTVYISRNPTGGGTQYEAVNLIGSKRTDGFAGDGAAKEYQLSAAELDEAGVTVKVSDKDGNSEELTEGEDFTVDREKGIVTFTTAPEATSSGADNVFITFSRTPEGYADRIDRCSIMALYGVGSPDRIFFAGNPEYKNTDWYCGYNDPTYIPDTSYSLVGNEETAIMGYLNISDYMAVVKEDNQQDSTVFSRSSSVDSSGEVLFSTEQGVQNIGAVSKHCFASFRDDPVFLSKSGVCAVTTVTVTLEKTVRRRSSLIDKKLSNEPDLSEAVGAVWGDWYLVCVNGRCYVADSKQKSYESRLSDNFLYEWYYWENIPARLFLEDDGVLWFGTEDGRICRFKDGDSMSRFSDDEEPIEARWETKLDDDGDFMSFKTMIRRGSGVLMKPYTSSSIKVYAQTEHDFGRLIRTAAMSIFDFNEIDFSNFSFNTLDAPQVVPFNKKVKKYKMLQLIVENKEPNQGFGVYGIIKRYVKGNYVK